MTNSTVSSIWSCAKFVVEHPNPLQRYAESGGVLHSRVKCFTGNQQTQEASPERKWVSSAAAARAPGKQRPPRWAGAAAQSPRPQRRLQRAPGNPPRAGSATKHRSLLLTTQSSAASVAMKHAQGQEEIFPDKRCESFFSKTSDFKTTFFFCIWKFNRAINGLQNYEENPLYAGKYTYSP